MQQLIFSVGKIAYYIKNIFDNESLLHSISVSGEVSGISRTGTSLYFTLKDSEAQLSCVCFIADMLTHFPKNGDKCIVKGSVGYYKKGGRLNFNVTDITLAGDGDEHTRLLLLKEKLRREGLFDEGRKLPLPQLPQRIAVVTSMGGAVIHDILKIHSHVSPSVDVDIYPVRVQGSGAAKEICAALAVLERTGCDLIIIARGGGSAEDLSQYNDEQLARCVASCNKPVISAVGHESDFTLCDLAADVRASTPTNAADIALSGYLEFKSDIIYKARMISSAAGSIFRESIADADSLLKRLFSAWQHYFLRQRSEIEMLSAKCAMHTDKHLSDSIMQANMLINSIESKNPLKVMQRGYAAVRHGGQAVSGVSYLVPGMEVDIRFKDGTAKANITDVSKNS